jgi:hypothetical protein
MDGLAGVVLCEAVGVSLGVPEGLWVVWVGSGAEEDVCGALGLSEVLVGLTVGVGVALRIGEGAKWVCATTTTTGSVGRGRGT